MTFGEKLFKLRKENQLSQESLAEKLNTTRQAVSKWENDLGYPETEKLLMIGNIFGVSMDYLLKDASEQANKPIEDGYYVSKEMAEGFLLASRKAAKYISLGLFFIALAFMPYFMFEELAFYFFPTVIFATIGIAFIASTAFLEEDQYRVLKQEILVFDTNYLQDLNGRYESLKKKYAPFLIAGLILFLAGFLPFGLQKKFFAEISSTYYPFFIGIVAIGIYILIHTTIILDAYKLLAKNELYTNRIFFKLRKKFRKKIDDF